VGVGVGGRFPSPRPGSCLRASSWRVWGPAKVAVTHPTAKVREAAGASDPKDALPAVSDGPGFGMTGRGGLAKGRGPERRSCLAGCPPPQADLGPILYLSPRPPGDPAPSFFLGARAEPDRPGQETRPRPPRRPTGPRRGGVAGLGELR
jgi:hypothetical protein